MTSAQDPIISDLKAEADRIYDAFMNGELSYIEAERQTAILDRKTTQRMTEEYMYMGRINN